MNRMVKKGLDILKTEGVKSLCVRGKNYISFRIKLLHHKDEVKDILFVNGCTLPHPQRYRVDHMMEQLEACGLMSDKVLYTDVEPEKLKYYRAVVIFRCPITDKVRELIEKAHFYNKRVFYDIDDLVIDKKYTDQIEFVQQMSKEDKRVYDDGVVRMGETMKLCDYCITTTPALARELKKYGKEVFVNRNVASEEMVKLSNKAVLDVEKTDDKVRIGYLSGSITHNPDFEMIKPAIVKILDEFPKVELVLMGHLDLPKDLEKYGDRIIKEPFVDWKELPRVIAGLDINLAPIEKSIFNEAKSENKWTEAALCKVVTVASDFGAFRDVIENGKTGVLCEGVDGWYKAVKKLVVDQDLRKEIGERAYEKAIKEYVTTYTGMGLARFIESRLAKNIAFVLPSTSISGGVIVAWRHCEILRKHGWDVTIINMDVSDDNVSYNGEEINVVSGVEHDVKARFNTMVATLYTTVDYILKYPRVNKRMYLVQGFETDFCSFGNPMRKVANATYMVPEGIKYLTVSKWCKKWLQNVFEQNVGFAPNGIDPAQYVWKKRTFKGKTRILIEGNSTDYYKNVDESFRITNKLDPEKYEIWYLSYRGEAKEWYRVDKFCHKVPPDEVGKLYGKCDILLKTSILESFSYPPLEMMATGGYVVVLPNEGNVEYLKDGENCLFYERGNYDDAVEKIEKIRMEKELRKKLADGAKKTVKKRNWKDLESKIVELYQ